MTFLASAHNIFKFSLGSFFIPFHMHHELLSESRNISCHILSVQIHSSYYHRCGAAHLNELVWLDVSQCEQNLQNQITFTVECEEKKRNATHFILMIHNLCVGFFRFLNFTGKAHIQAHTEKKIKI